MFVHTAENQGWLRARWQALATHLDADRVAADAAWDALVRHYGEPHRAYHNLSHIMAMLRHADTERQHMSQPEVVELATWFHDIIYDTHSTDNEARSAAWAHHAMHAMRIDAQLIAPVGQCILATQKHEAEAQASSDLRLFLDLDLAILGSSPETYRRYSQAVRAEYDWVPLQAYCTGRSEILRRFVARPALFFTPSMHTRFEAQARNNIAWELKELSSLQTGK